MEVTGAAPARDSVPNRTRKRLLREPLFWAAVTVFSGTVLGIFSTIWQATLRDSFYVDPAARLLAQIPGSVGEALVMSSSLGAVYLAWNVLRVTGRRLASLGAGLLALLLLAEAVGVAVAVYRSTGERWQGYAAFPFPAIEAAAFLAIFFLPPIVLLSFAALALAAREKKLGGLLSFLFLLSLPLGTLWFLLFAPGPNAIGPPTGLVASLLGSYATGMSLLEAPLWILLGATFLRRARRGALGEAFRVREKENLEAARRLYEEGLGQGNTSVVDDLVSEDFRDLRRGARGKLAMERVLSTLWKSYPDLSVMVEDQRAEGDLVRTRLTLSGTDRGGVLWYPPTGRQATFTAEFVDRFVEGLLIEHSGQADTEELLRQLGLTQAHAPSPSETRT